MKLLLSSDSYVYFYNGKYYGSNGGSEGFFKRYLRIFESMRLVARTKQVYTMPNDGYDELDSERIEVWPFPFFQGPKEYAKVYLKGKKCLKNVTSDCDAAILRIPSTTAYQVMGEVIKSKMPFCIEVVIDPYDSLLSSNGLLNKFYYRSWYNDLLKACKYADGVSCVTSQYLQKRYFPAKNDAFTSNYSSIALPIGMYSSARQFPQKDEFVIAHVAGQVKFEGRKGHKELIDAVAMANNKGYNTRIVFVGGDYMNGIKKLSDYANNIGVLDKIEFAGYLKTKKEVLEQLSKADIFVMPTKAEGLPRSIIEAMSQGLPCITTNVSGNPELIQSEFLIDDFYDTNILAEKIIALVSNKELYESASKYNFENSKNYEESVLQARRDEFYNNLKKRIRL